MNNFTARYGNWRSKMNEEQRKALMKHLLSGKKARIYWAVGSYAEDYSDVRFGLCTMHIVYASSDDYECEYVIHPRLWKRWEPWEPLSEPRVFRWREAPGPVESGPQKSLLAAVSDGAVFDVVATEVL